MRPIVANEYIPSEKSKHPPFIQHSIRRSLDPKSHPCVHNSANAPIMRQKYPCHIHLHISVRPISVLLYSHKMSYVTCTTMVFWPEF